VSDQLHAAERTRCPLSGALVSPALGLDISKKGRNFLTLVGIRNRVLPACILVTTLTEPSRLGFSLK